MQFGTIKHSGVLPGHNFRKENILMQTEITENEKINPQAQILTIGIKSLRNITIWPLSVGDQISMSSIISKSAAEFFAKDEQSEAALFQFGLDKIIEHIKEILKLILDENEDADQVLRNMNNDQLIGLAELIFQMNYERSVKNAKGLFERIKSNLSPSERPQPTSVSNTEDTESPISIIENLEMEDSPADSLDSFMTVQ